MPENQDEEKIKQMIDNLVEKAKKASLEYLKLSQEDVDRIVKAMSMAGLEHHMELAKISKLRKFYKIPACRETDSKSAWIFESVFKTCLDSNTQNIIRVNARIFFFCRIIIGL